MSAPRDIAAGPRLPTIGDRAFLLDAGVIVGVSVAISIAADQLAFMTVLVPLLLALRLGLWWRLPLAERGHGVGVELILLGLCTALGAFNDWNSVVNHRIYDYAVPVYYPAATTIPIWMLLFWGMILRFLITLFRWRRLDPPAVASSAFGPGPGTGARSLLRIGVALALVFATRQAIYAWYLHPVLSWLPFALALGVWLLLSRPGAYEAKILAIFAVGGTLIEVLYIQAGGLHRYHLGWLGGVPLWIALWWLLAALIWQDLSARVLGALTGRLDRPSRGLAAPGSSR